MKAVTRRPYATEVGADWELVASYPALPPDYAPQRRHELQEVINALLWIIHTGAQWRALPRDFRILSRYSGAREAPSRAVVMDSRTLPSSLERRNRAGWDAVKKKQGAKLRAIIDTLGNRITGCRWPGNVRDRAEMGVFTEKIHDATGAKVEVASVDQGYTGSGPAEQAENQGNDPHVVKPAKARHGLVRHGATTDSERLPRRNRLLSAPRSSAQLPNYLYIVFAGLAMPGSPGMPDRLQHQTHYVEDKLSFLVKNARDILILLAGAHSTIKSRQYFVTVIARALKLMSTFTRSRTTAPVSWDRPRGLSQLRLSGSLAIRAEIFRSFAEVEAKWRKAQAHCACYGFQSFEWLSAWQETIGAAEGIEPYIVHIAGENGDTLMLLPLGIERRFGVSFTSFLGGAVADYNAPIVCPDFAARLDAVLLDRLLAWVMERLPPTDVIAFKRMPLVIDGVANPLARLAGAKYICDAYCATLSDTFAEFQKRRSAKFFSTARRKWRRLSEVAPTSLCIAESPDDVAEILRVLVRQKRRRLRELGSSDPFARLGYLAFYENLARRHWAGGLIQTSALRVGGAVVATHWGMVFRNRFYWLMPAYEGADWAQFSVGTLLMQSLVEWSISKGLKKFDLTVGDEAYKNLWADHTLPLYEHIRGMTGKGKIYSKVRLAGKRLSERAKRREWLRTLVKVLRSSAWWPGR
jgi:CelD/BcsL family acetyltransferase involved in cellulose biosynthesis